MHGTYLYQITTKTMLEKISNSMFVRILINLSKGQEYITQNTTTFGLLKVDNWTNEQIKTD